MSNTTPVALHSELATGFCLSDLLFKNQEACVVLCAYVRALRTTCHLKKFHHRKFFLFFLWHVEAPLLCLGSDF